MQPTCKKQARASECLFEACFEYLICKNKPVASTFDLCDPKISIYLLMFVYLPFHIDFYTLFIYPVTEYCIL